MVTTHGSGTVPPASPSLSSSLNIHPQNGLAESVYEAWMRRHGFKFGSGLRDVAVVAS